MEGPSRLSFKVIPVTYRTNTSKLKIREVLSNKEVVRVEMSVLFFSQLIYLLLEMFSMLLSQSAGCEIGWKMLS